MRATDLDEDLRNRLLIEQRNEIVGHMVYGRLANIVEDPNNREVLGKIAEDELRHYEFLGSLTGEEVAPSRWAVSYYTFLARVLGLTFVVKLMEGGEKKAQKIYGALEESVPGIRGLIRDEEAHEHELIAMIDEERLEYIGSIVLGLNDALVELTGTLAGLSFAFQNTSIIALSGLITGVAASLSMGASEYLSTRAEDGENAFRAGIYTGASYILTVFLLVLPFFVFDSYLLSLPLTLIAAVLIIMVFNYYVSVAKDLDFWKQFTEMTGISLGVAALSFLVGVLINVFLGVDL